MTKKELIKKLDFYLDGRVDCEGNMSVYADSLADFLESEGLVTVEEEQESLEQYKDNMNKGYV